MIPPVHSRRAARARLSFEQLEDRTAPSVTTVPDWAEINNSQSTAFYMGRGGNVTWSGLSIHSSNDDDWYRFGLAHTGVFESAVSILFTHADGDLDMALFDASGSVLRFAEGNVDNETISLNGFAAGEYFLRVRGYTGATNNYTFKLADPQGPGPGDFAEDNDVPARAFVLPNITGTLATSGFDIRSNADVDYFSVQLQATGTANDLVRVSEFDTALVDIDLTLFDAGLNPLRSADTDANEESISLLGLAPGRYFLKAYPHPRVSVSTAASYSFNMSLPALGASGDRFEPNNSAPASKSLGTFSGTNSFQYLSLQPAGDQDWYHFNIDRAGTSEDYVRAGFSNAQGDIDLELYASNGTTLLEHSRGVGNSETISLAGRPAGMYLLKVYGAGGAGNPNYSLAYQAPVATATPDADEENDTREAATVLGTLTAPLIRSNLSVVPMADDDWYRFTLGGTGGVSDKAKIEFANVFGDLSLALFDSTGSATPLRSSTTSSNVEEISLSGLSAGTYFLRIFGHLGAGNSNYTLRIDPPTADVTADRFEPNNSTLGASDLGTIRDATPRTVGGLTLSPAGDTDFFRFNTVATAGQGHYAKIDFANALGDLDLELLDAAGNVLTRSNGTGNTELISLAGRAAGGYYLRVYGYDGNNSPGYVLSILAPTGEGIAADAYESNNTLGTATLVRSGAGETITGPASIENLSIHNGTDEDVFKFKTVATGTAASRVSARFLNADGNLTLELLNASGAVLAISDTNGDGESVSLQGRPAGTYYARVKGKAGGTNGYKLTVEAPVPATSPADAKDDWTIFVYMTASDLEKPAFDDINEMETAVASLPDTVNVVVLWDQSSNGTMYSSANGAQTPWGTTGRAVIQGDTNMSQVATRFDLTINEQNTGSAAALKSFLTWGVAQAPANNYGLVMWDHGGGLVGGFNFDDSDGVTADNMTSTELVQALTGGPRMKFVAFDACLMQTVEMGYNLRALTDVYVASQEVIDGPGFDYRTSFSSLNVAAPGLVTAPMIANGLVTSFQAQYGTTNNDTTLSAFDTSKYVALAAALRTFTDAIGPATNTQLDRMRDSVLAAIQYYGLDECRDLGGIMNGIANDFGLPVAMRTAAAGVVTALNAALLFRTADPRNSSGASIVAPVSADVKDLKTFSEQAATWLKTTNWQFFVNKMQSAESGPVASGPDFAENNNTAAEARTLNVSGVGNIVSGLTLHTAGDVDWYRIRFAEDGGSGHQAQFVSDSETTVTLQVYDATGTTVLFAHTAANEATVGLGSLTAGTYLLKVSAGAPVKRYALRLDLPAGPAARNTAKSKGNEVGKAQDGLSFQSVLATGEEAWFRIGTTRLAVPRSFALDFKLPDGVTATVSLEDEEGNPVGDPVTGENGRLWLTATGAGESYFVRLTAVTGDGVANLDLTAAQVFEDEFNRTVLGPNYEVLTGNPTIVAGNLRSVNGTGAPATSVAMVAGLRATDFTVTGTVNVIAKESAGLVARHTGSGNRNYYFADMMMDATGKLYARINRNLNGAVTALKSVRMLPHDDYYLRFEVTGSYLELSVNGVKQVSVFDTAISGEGSAGVRQTGGTVMNVNLASQTIADLPLADDLTFRRSHWLSPITDFIIIGGIAYVNGPTMLAYANTLPVSDGTTSAQIMVPLNRTTSGSVIARYNAAAAASYYEARLTQTMVRGVAVYTVGLYATVNGKTSLLGTALAGAGVGELGLSVHGNVITALFNDIPVVTRVNSLVKAPGRFGIAGKADVAFNEFNAERSTTATSAADNFNRADASSLGGAWQSMLGGHGISGNQARGTTANNLSVLAAASQEDMIVSATLSLTATGASSAGLIARYQGTANANYYEGAIERVGTQVKATIYRNVAGRRTALGVSAGLSPTLTTAAVEFTVTGNTMILRVDGNILLTRTDLMIAGPGVAGIRGSAKTQAEDFGVAGP